MKLNRCEAERKARALTISDAVCVRIRQKSIKNRFEICAWLEESPGEAKVITSGTSLEEAIRKLELLSFDERQALLGK